MYRVHRCTGCLWLHKRKRYLDTSQRSLSTNVFSAVPAPATEDVGSRDGLAQVELPRVTNCAGVGSAGRPLTGSSLCLPHIASTNAYRILYCGMRCVCVCVINKLLKCSNVLVWPRRRSLRGDAFHIIPIPCACGHTPPHSPPQSSLVTRAAPYFRAGSK